MAVIHLLRAWLGGVLLIATAVTAAHAQSILDPTVTQQATGNDHACELTMVDWCGGFNGDGELGNGLTRDGATPVAATGRGSASLRKQGVFIASAVPDSGLLGSGLPPSAQTGGYATLTVDLSQAAVFANVTSIEIRGDHPFLPTLGHIVYNKISTPTLITSTGSATFIAGDNAASTSVAVDPAITLSDGDSSTGASATVAVSGNFQSGEDVLAFVNDGATMGNIAASYNATSGVLTLASSGASATLAQWQAALRSVTYTDSAITPNAATRTVSFTFTDGSGSTSNTATRTVQVVPTDQTPIVTTSVGSVNYTIGGNPITIDSGITVSDIDNSTLASAVVSITNDFHSGDALLFINDGTSMGNITGSYNAGTGVLTLTSAGASATLAQWANTLRTVRFRTTSAMIGQRTISFVVNDGIKNSAAQSVVVDAAFISITPTVLPDATVGAAYNLTFSASNGTPPYTFAISGGSLPNGMVLSSGGILSGTPTAAGTFDFSVQVTDYASAATATTRSITVTAPPLTLAPASLPDGAYQSPYPPVGFVASGGTAPYTYTALGLPAGITLNASTGTLSGTPAAAGTYPIAVTATDSSMGWITNYMTWVIDKATQTLRFTSAAPSPAAVGATYTPIAVSSSGLAPVLTIDVTASSVCTLSAGTVKFVGTGTCVIDADQPGDANYLAATQVQQSVAVGKASSSAALGVSPASTVYGQGTTLTASITSTNTNAGGTVAFTEGATALPGCGAVPLTGGQAQCQTASLSVAAHAITAAYSGDANTVASTSAPASVTVSKAATTTAITPPAAITLGNPVSVTAAVTVTAPGAGTPTGTIHISDGDNAAGDSCTIALPATSCALTPSSAGSKTLTATYLPDAAASANFTGSSGTGSLAVNPAQAGSVLTSSANPSVYGQSVTLTGTVTPASGGVTPTTGHGVHFLIDGAEVCAGATLSPTGTANAASATCVVPQANLGVASHALAFQYGGDGNNQASTATATQSVNAASTTTTIAPASAITLGGTVAVQVTVAAQAPGAGTPSGSVTVSDGSASCVATLTDGAGSCTLTPPAPAGAHQLVAAYAATQEFAASTGTATLTVNAAPAGTVLTSSANPSSFGQPPTLTATVTPTAGNPTPTGTVTFTDGGTTLCHAVALSDGNATCTPASLSVGTHPIQASYSGDANTAASSATLDQVVNRDATTMTLTASPNPAGAGQTVTLTATVYGDPPTGTVTFLDGASVLGSAPLAVTGTASSAATFTIATLSAGTHALSATYPGDANNSPSASSVVTLSVGAPRVPVPAPALSTWMLALLGTILAAAGSLKRRRGLK